jgi:hypothetical protein
LFLGQNFAELLKQTFLLEKRGKLEHQLSQDQSKFQRAIFQQDKPVHSWRIQKAGQFSIDIAKLIWMKLQVSPVQSVFFCMSGFAAYWQDMRGADQHFITIAT